jgi:hypothetical protein
LPYSVLSFRVRSMIVPRIRRSWSHSSRRDERRDSSIHFRRTTSRSQNRVSLSSRNAIERQRANSGRVELSDASKALAPTDVPLPMICGIIRRDLRWRSSVSARSSTRSQNCSILVSISSFSRPTRAPSEICHLRFAICHLAAIRGPS